MPAKTETGMSPVAVHGATAVAPADARALHEGGVKFVDVRGPELYRAGHVPGAISLPKAMSDGRSEFTQERFSLLIKPEDHVVIYCNGPRCALASLACAEAVKWGYTNVHYFRDGFPGWKAAGYPIELGENTDRLD